MGRLPVGLPTIERRFLECLKGKSLGLGPTDLVKSYFQTQDLSKKTGWLHFSRLKIGISSGSIRKIVSYMGPDGERFGDARNDGFLQRKADAEAKPPEVVATWQLGRWYQNSAVRVSWEYCPVRNRLRHVAVVTVGVADFMRCHLCNRFHFLGLSPRVKDSRPQVWELDPAICWQEYEDELSVELMVDPDTHRSQPSRIDRVRKGGRWTGLRFRVSWDEDPYKRMSLMEWEERKKVLGESTNVPVEG